MSFAHPGDRWSTVSEMLLFVGYSPAYVDPTCYYQMILMDR